MIHKVTRIVDEGAGFVSMICHDGDLDKQAALAWIKLRYGSGGAVIKFLTWTDAGGSGIIQIFNDAIPSSELDKQWNEFLKHDGWII